MDKQILVKIDNYGPEGLEWAAALYESYAADYEWIARQKLASDRLSTASGTKSSSGHYAEAAERLCEELDYAMYNIEDNY